MTAFLCVRAFGSNVPGDFIEVPDGAAVSSYYFLPASSAVAQVDTATATETITAPAADADAKAAKAVEVARLEAELAAAEKE